MEAPSDRENDPSYWRECWEADGQELERSERVQGQLQAVLQTLQQRCADLDGENARIRAEVGLDAASARLEGEVESVLQARQALEARQSALSLEIQRHQAECEARAAKSTAQVELLAESAAASEALEEACRDADVRRERADLKARSMVMDEALHRGAEEAEQLQAQLRAQEADTAELREALADSWAARADDAAGDAAAPAEASDPGAALESLKGMEEELRWLAKMQQESAAEVHHVQKLERTEAVLQAQLRVASEENAALRSARMDLGDAGAAMREAIAYQSERFVGRVDGLAEERRRTDTDREKLVREYAEMRSRLDALAPELASLVGLEERHSQLEAERLSLATESERLHAVNAALGVLLLGEDAAPPGMGDDSGAGVAQAITRLLQLQRRLGDREASHAEEKQRLADMIRSLERDAASGSLQKPQETAPAAGVRAAAKQASSQTGSKNATVPSLASASKALKGGFGRLRDVAGV